MNYSRMFDWVFDAIDNGIKLAVPDEWYGIFVQVCKDFKVTLVTGLVIVCNGIGTNVDNAMMDACSYLASTDYPQDDIMDVELVNAEEEQA